MSERNEEKSDKATWLPNLVGGVSIWKLAVDLNEPKFFDGRLLVPETEGSESLPVTVRWDLTGLTPLAEAQAKWPEEVGAAVRDFQAALERVAKVFATPDSGFDRYKSAFTMPALDAEGGASYFYSHDKNKLFVINWGASPRDMGGRAEYVFGYEDWGKVVEKDALTSTPQLAAALATGENATIGQPVPGKDDKTKKKAADEEKKKKAAKKDAAANERAWWIWPLFALIAIALVLLALFLLRACEPPVPVALEDAATDALASDADETDAVADRAGADDEAGADGAGLPDVGDAGDAGDGSAEAAGGDAGDGGRDGAKDGSLAAGDDDDDDPGGGGGGGAGGGGGTVIVKTFPGAGGGGGGGERTSVHRRHYHADAVHWRVTSGGEKLARTEQRGGRYDVWLVPGKTFEGVRVEWQDQAGQWHPH